ncbi:aerobic-type carbon monoxide dehydrogenase, large subunit CoxL/CutL-like protein [Bradyrhizobium sp. YR681]|uniref:xanthine dehydrogenase family protein molybdopterin-binding subunit n=1 Tax=Bradyrhizobium sp. YR681 TaxID=1144344 RepID=UPI000270D7E0|nr:xanthine dehydrogenase family protein molybdopterin-binding subunit [Bradyrhizobium sp. YR681]EJN12118.1 aerobic-type carbon monoxide dehydrogenase, large subunit CoxL/CutL-like protein [Bradyrhizobium sp. YR681]
MEALQSNIAHIGKPTSRVDGKLKVTGRARYAAEYPAADLLHGVIVSATVPAGRITKLELDRARAVPGVVQIFTHENRGKAAWLDRKWRDEVAPPGHPFRPLHSDRILFDGQPIALVVADSFEAARDAASLVRAEYDIDDFCTELEVRRPEAYDPPEKRSGIPPPPEPRGDAEDAFDRAKHRISSEYRINAEHHNPMELFGTTCVFEGPGQLTIYEKTQGSQNSQGYVTSVFGLRSKNVRVINHYVGGAFGAALRPQQQLFFAVMASLELKRSVRVTLTRSQMFYIGYRPDTYHAIALAADNKGRLTSIMHDAVAATSHHEDYQEAVVNWSGMMYHCDNVKLSYALAKLNTATPCDMRAPGASVGVNAFECAIDELCHDVGIDPLEFRRINFASIDENTGKMLTSKALLECYQQGAAAIGWDRRPVKPRSLKDGRELVGLGMATGMWDAFLMKAAAEAKLTADGRLEVSTAASDIGTGTWTILAQIGADALGLPLEAITSRIGDSTLPASPVEGGSWTAASNGSAVMAACEAIKATLFKHARAMTNSPVAQAEYDDVVFAGGRIALKNDLARSLSFAEVMHAADLAEITETGKAAPSLLQMRKYISYTHSAVFAEVRVDEDLGVVRIPRIVCAAAAGRIINPKTARSQILGGVVMGIGMALHEEAMTDHRLGKIMNHSLAEYHVPAHADIADIEVIFVDETDEKVSPLGVKGLGEIGIVGTAAAVANAIFNATGRRVRDFPITLDKLLA